MYVHVYACSCVCVCACVCTCVCTCVCMCVCTCACVHVQVYVSMLHSTHICKHVKVHSMFGFTQMHIYIYKNRSWQDISANRVNEWHFYFVILAYYNAPLQTFRQVIVNIQANSLSLSTCMMKRFSSDITEWLPMSSETYKCIKKITN